MSAVPQPKRRGRPPSGGREAILEAALTLVREEGIARLTSREVAARAGVSDASVYYHFGDRRRLLEAVYAHGMQKVSYMADLPPDIDYTVVLRRAFASLEQYFDGALPLLHAARADVELGQVLADFIEANDLGPHRGVTTIGDYLRGEQAAGRVNPDVDVDAVALLVIDAAFSRTARGQLIRPDDGDERLPSPERLLATLDLLLRHPRNSPDQPAVVSSC